MAMKTLRESQTTSEENKFMKAYSTMLIEVERMNTELINNASRVSNDVYAKKEKRIEDLRECLVLFNQSFFKMMYYKQEMVTWKTKALDKELEFVNFVTKSLNSESNRR